MGLQESDTTERLSTQHTALSCFIKDGPRVSHTRSMAVTQSKVLVASLPPLTRLRVVLLEHLVTAQAALQGCTSSEEMNTLKLR